LEWLLKMRLEDQVPLLNVEDMDSPLLIITCERAEYLERALWKMLKYHPSNALMSKEQNQQQLRGEIARTKGRMIGSPIIISQDGGNAAVQAVIESYRNLFERKLGVPLYHIQHIPAEIPTSGYSWNDWEVPYKKLAIHYGYALDQVFSGRVYEGKERQHTRRMPRPPLPKRVVILEEDIEISRDFFSLMNATADILDEDDTLLAVSAYNDNGNENHVLDHKRLVRSDFFPGLGWMINRQTWEGPTKHPEAALKGRWPDGYWDDWIREANVRNGRQVLRPEISRSFHFGNVKGASDSEAAMKLSKIQLDEINVRWEEEDLSYLDPVTFAKQYWDRVHRAELVKTDFDAKKLVAHKDVRIAYSDWKQFKSLAESLSIMSDEKAGVPRTAYEGIVEVRYGAGNYFIYLTPPYLNETTKPADFGVKAWAGWSKDALLHRLQIADKTDDFAMW
jgi:alpha-1,3-mannosyl-glycoprotein beta-1,2-N-acetylglucosaminyltransferase